MILKLQILDELLEPLFQAQTEINALHLVVVGDTRTPYHYGPHGGTLTTGRTDGGTLHRRGSEALRGPPRWGGVEATLYPLTCGF